MPTYSTRSVPAVSWSGRPQAGAAPTYESAVTYEENGYTYEGAGFTMTMYSTLVHPSTSYASRVIPA